jgi:hypothetical protein
MKCRQLGDRYLLPALLRRSLRLRPQSPTTDQRDNGKD